MVESIGVLSVSISIRVFCLSVLAVGVESSVLASLVLSTGFVFGSCCIVFSLGLAVVGVLAVSSVVSLDGVLGDVEGFFFGVVLEGLGVDFLGFTVVDVSVVVSSDGDSESSAVGSGVSSGTVEGDPPKRSLIRGVSGLVVVDVGFV